MSATGGDEPSCSDDPVTRAKRAGWKIDPAIEESMRNLPPESQLYDVTGQPPSEVIRVYPDSDGFYELKRPDGGDKER